MTTLFGCGPYFDSNAVLISFAILFLFKPLAYYAFIRSFRYRVSRPIPMSPRTVVKITAVRTIVGAALVGAGYVAVATMRSNELVAWSWVYLFAERIIVWFLLGKYMAGLRSSRLTGWTVSGTLLNAAFDLSLAAGLFTGFAGPAIVLTVIGAVLLLLHRAGSAADLKSRYDAVPHCALCGYNLTGNLSGICPECGTPPSAAPATAR